MAGLGPATHVFAAAAVTEQTETAESHPAIADHEAMRYVMVICVKS
jgi:hypothetical protein